MSRTWMNTKPCHSSQAGSTSISLRSRHLVDPFLLMAGYVAVDVVRLDDGLCAGIRTTGTVNPCGTSFVAIWKES